MNTLDFKSLPKDIARISREMYGGYGTSNQVGTQYFRAFFKRLKGFDYQVVLQHQMLSYPHRYVLDFILSTDELWNKHGADIWLGLLQAETTRVDASKALDQLGDYADIEFLSRYVEVDALTFIISSGNVSPRSKRLTLEYFSKFPYGLVPSPLDAEDLDGMYFVSKEILSSLRQHLISQHGFSPIGCNDNNAHEYIAALRETFESADLIP